MRGSYLLLRGETFHIRMRVPASPVPAIGCSELKLSLYENRKRDAQLKASFLALHVRAFFADLRQALKSPSRTEVTQPVDSWRRKMIDRDSLLHGKPRRERTTPLPPRGRIFVLTGVE
jgi:hypothetical protein